MNELDRNVKMSNLMGNAMYTDFVSKQPLDQHKELALYFDWDTGMKHTIATDENDVVTLVRSEPDETINEVKNKVTNGEELEPGFLEKMGNMVKGVAKWSMSSTKKDWYTAISKAGFAFSDTLEQGSNLITGGNIKTIFEDQPRIFRMINPDTGSDITLKVSNRDIKNNFTDMMPEFQPGAKYHPFDQDGKLKEGWQEISTSVFESDKMKYETEAFTPAALTEYVIQYGAPGMGIYQFLGKVDKLRKMPFTRIILAELGVEFLGATQKKDDINLANLLQNFGVFENPDTVANFIREAIAADMDDTVFERKVKNMVGNAPFGVAIGSTFEGVRIASQIYKTMKKLKYNREGREILADINGYTISKNPDINGDFSVSDKNGVVLASFKTQEEADQFAATSPGNLEAKSVSAAATPEDQKINFKTTLPFYSNVVNAIREIDIPEGGMDVTQFTNTIKNTKGVKQSELDDMGFDEFFLDDKPAIVTQERVNEFLETKDLSKNVNTTVLGEADAPNSNEINFTTNVLNVDPRLRGAIDYDDAKLIVKNNENLYERFQDFIQEMKRGNESDFDNLTEDDYLDEFLRMKGITKATSKTKTKFDEYVLPGGEDYREMLLTTKGTQIFTKDHFRKAGADVPKGENILAHIRFNTRNINGKKVLFIEEIQSDLHQAGRQVGYIDKNLKAKRQKLITQLNDLIKEVGEFKVADDPRYPEIERQIKIIDASSGTIPNAPFKKNWHELSMKRIIKYAIDNGFEGISFTPASVQAARYPGADADFTVFYDQVLPKFVNKFSKKYNAKLVNTNLSQSGLKFNTNSAPYNYENTVLRDAKNLEDAFDLIDRNDYLLSEFALFVRDETTEFKNKDEAMIFIDTAPESELVPYKESFLMNDYGLDLTGDLDNVVPYLEFTPEMINTIKSEGVPVAALEDRETSATRTV